MLKIAQQVMLNNCSQTRQENFGCLGCIVIEACRCPGDSVMNGGSESTSDMAMMHICMLLYYYLSGIMRDKYMSKPVDIALRSSTCSKPCLQLCAILFTTINMAMHFFFRKKS
uniref:Uncharacterized protein n=1 Tax=Arundo donax TaxID=35708 RepID=A0A0A8XQD9_ARUDO